MEVLHTAGVLALLQIKFDVLCHSCVAGDGLAGSAGGNHYGGFPLIMVRLAGCFSSPAGRETSRGRTIPLISGAPSQDVGICAISMNRPFQNRSMKAPDITQTPQDGSDRIREPWLIWICGPKGQVLSHPEPCPDLAGTAPEICWDPGWAERLHPEDADAVLAGWKESLATGTPWRGNYRIRGRDGVYRTVAERGSPVRDTDRRILFWVGISLDPTGLDPEALHAQSGIMEQSGVSADELLRVVAAILPVGWLNPENAAVRITVEGREYRSTGFSGRSPRQESSILVHGRVAGRVEISHREGEAWFLPDGHSVADAVAARLGQLLEQVQPDGSSNRSEESYRLLYEQMLESYTLYEVVRDGDGNPVDYRIVELNEKAADIFSRKRNDLIGQRLFEVFPAIREGARIIYGEVAERGVPVRRRLQEPGSGRWYDLYIFRPEPGRLAIVGQEITRQKKAERALRESEERFRGVFEQVGTGIALIDPEGRIRDANPAFVRVFGYSEDELYGMEFCDLSFPPEKEAAGLFLQESAPRETRYLKKDGGIIWGRVTMSPLRDQEGEGLVIAMVEDVTERREMQDALFASEERFRMIAQRSFDVIIICHADQGIAYISPAVIRILGYTPEEMLGQQCRDYLREEASSGWEEVFGRVERGESVEGSLMEFRRKDGSVAVLEMNSSPVVEEGKVIGVQIIGRDVSDRRHYEKLRLQAFEQIEQNIEQFAVLADHIRLPLQVILGMADLLGDEAAPETIREQVERINAIVKQLDEGWVESREIREFLRRNELI